MAHVWYIDQQTGGWTLALLETEAVDIGPQLAGATPRQHGTAAPALLLRSCAGASEQWLLMSAEPHLLAVNGEPLHAGIRLVNDKDDIRGAGNGRLFFSTERLPKIEPFSGSERPLHCPRCTLAIGTSTPIVRCECGTVYHHDPAQGLECFDHGTHCSTCGRPTELTESYRWQPGEL